MENNPINRHGQCPCCEYGWDGGDILDSLRQLSVFANKGEADLKRMAAECYGYTETNKTRFSNLIGHDLLINGEEIGLWQCPKCGHVWNKTTGEHFASMTQAMNRLKKDNNEEDILVF